MTTTPITVMLVDDQNLVRGGLAMLVSSQSDLTVAAEAENGAQAVTEFQRLNDAGQQPDVVLMDVRMPVMDGLQATSRILEISDHPKVVMLTTFDIDDYVYEAVRLGASGFLLKDAPPEQLLDAIRTVHRGDAVIAPSATKRLMEHMVPLLTTPEHKQSILHREKIERLTPREYEILILMAQGLSNAELCTELYLSEATVKTHVSHILAKLNARDRVQAVVVAYEAGLMNG